jgi:putative transposase
LADTYAMQLHLDEISRHVAAGAHAVLLMDRAGWHTTANLDVPGNISPIFLPSRAPELNPVENIWQYLRGLCHVVAPRTRRACALFKFTQP